MTDSFILVMRALVVAALALATATVTLVTVTRTPAAGTLAIRSCGTFGEIYDFHSAAEARKSALGKCQGQVSRVRATLKRGCYKDGGKEGVIRTFFCDAKG